MKKQFVKPQKKCEIKFVTIYEPSKHQTITMGGVKRGFHPAYRYGDFRQIAPRYGYEVFYWGSVRSFIEGIPYSVIYNQEKDISIMCGEIDHHKHVEPRFKAVAKKEINALLKRKILSTCDEMLFFQCAMNRGLFKVEQK